MPILCRHLSSAAEKLSRFKDIKVSKFKDFKIDLMLSSILPSDFSLKIKQDRHYNSCSILTLSASVFAWARFFVAPFMLLKRE